jgi:hypothetical protein
LAAAAALGWRLHRPPADLAWTLGQPTAAADELFGSQLPRFVVALARRSKHQTEQRGGAEAAQLLREQSEQTLASAGQVDAGLAEDAARLVRAADALDRTGRLWLDAVHRVNRRIRALGLPYYLDGNALQIASRSSGKVRQQFYVTTYRVQQVRRFEEQGRPYAALHVRRLDRLNIAGSRLGTVRPDEPFALVMLDVIEETVAERLEAVGTRQSCELGSWGAPGRIDELCARTLTDLMVARGLDVQADREAAAELLTKLQIDATERHEIQHQVDGEDLDIPTELYQLVPWAEDRSLRVVAQELSAHLAELSSGDELATAWRLADLTGHLVRRRSRTAYRYAAGVIVGRLSDRPVIDTDGRVDLAQLEAFWQRAADRPAELAAWITPAARTIHEDLFDAPVASLPPPGE